MPHRAFTTGIASGSWTICSPPAATAAATRAKNWSTTTAAKCLIRFVVELTFLNGRGHA